VRKRRTCCLYVANEDFDVKPSFGFSLPVSPREIQMTQPRRSICLLMTAMCVSALSLSGTVHAQTAAFPSKTIRVIVPFPAGGLVDGMARMLMPEISKSIGQTIVVDNRSGASGAIGAAAAAQSPADGYTLLLVLDSHAINPLVYKTLPYDADKDFSPISLIARAPMVAVVNENFPPNNIGELVKYAKEHPNAVNFASVGAGSASHLTAELFNMAANVSMTHVPYKGGAPAQTDLMGGQVQLMWGTAPYAQSLVKAGKVKALGQASATRSVAFPFLPTVAEQGLSGFEAYGWIGLLAPGGTPPSIISFWNQQFANAVKNSEISKRLADQGFEVVVSSPERFRSFIQSEQKTWAKVIKERGVTLQ
jgi:tripartite-type tricarboxylate transporter receptor subunit TctC